MISAAEVQAIILNVTANVLTSLLALSLRGGRNLLTGRHRAPVNPLTAAIASTSATFEWTGTGLVEEVALFLQSPEAEAIIRQIYACRLVENESKRLSEVEQEFTASLAAFLGADRKIMANESSLLFKEVLQSCERQLAKAIENGLLAAHEAKSALRYNILHDELAVISKNLEFLTANRHARFKDVLEFERKYREQVAQRHGDIVPPNFDSARRVPIDDIYVPPQFLRLRPEKTEANKPLNPVDILGVLKRAVLLGNPGGGKSTFVQKLAHDLAAKYPERIVARRSLTPLLVVLRDYGTQKQTKHCSIVQFIETTSTSTYQLPPPTGAVEYLLLNGRAIVIFDGLDELLDTSYRQEITRDIEGFCNLYPSAPALVTSREVGYEQAPLDATFRTYLLQPFTDPQVLQYVNKWFAADQDLTRQQQTEKARGFFQESRIVADLCSNPLMLSLMCNIYRGENYIPSNRPEVYEKCALMLFERWDKSRGIRTPLPIEQHVRPTMMYLAHWIYSDPSLQSGVTERRLIAQATEYLCPRRFEDKDEAERASEQFISFCRGRAWVFTDTGTMKEGERLYQFTHRTFLEYFTAAHLVRTHATPSDLLTILLPRIVAREWDVVAQLAFQIQNRNVESAGDELLKALLRKSRDGNSAKSWNLLSFATRSLEFLVPSPSVTRELATAAVEEIIRAAQQQQPVQQQESATDLEVLSGLLNASAENRNVIAATIEAQLNRCVAADDAATAAIASEIGLHLNVALHHRRTVPARKSPPPPSRPPEPTLQQFWRSVSDRIFDENWSRIETLGRSSPILGLDAYRRGKLSLEAMLERYGADFIFQPIKYRAFRNVSMGALVDQFQPIVRGLVHDPRSETELKTIGEWLLHKAPPWTRLRYASLHFGFPHLGAFGGFDLPSQPAQAASHVDPAVTFGKLCVLAVILESMESRRHDLARIMENVRQRRQEVLFGILLGRFDPASRTNASRHLEQLGLRPDQRELVRKWLNHEVSFVSVTQSQFRSR
jgi:hypothetical protein